MLYRVNQQLDYEIGMDDLDAAVVLWWYLQQELAIVATDERLGPLGPGALTRI